MLMGYVIHVADFISHRSFRMYV